MSHNESTGRRFGSQLSNNKPLTTRNQTPKDKIHTEMPRRSTEKENEAQLPLNQEQAAPPTKKFHASKVIKDENKVVTPNMVKQKASCQLREYFVYIGHTTVGVPIEKSFQYNNIAIKPLKLTLNTPPDLAKGFKLCKSVYAIAPVSVCEINWIWKPLELGQFESFALFDVGDGRQVKITINGSCVPPNLLPLKKRLAQVVFELEDDPPRQAKRPCLIQKAVLAAIKEETSEDLSIIKQEQFKLDTTKEKGELFDIFVD